MRSHAQTHRQMFIAESEMHYDDVNRFNYANCSFKLIRPKFGLAEPGRLSQQRGENTPEYPEKHNPPVCLGPLLFARRPANEQSHGRVWKAPRSLLQSPDTWMCLDCQVSSERQCWGDSRCSSIPPPRPAPLHPSSLCPSPLRSPFHPLKG